jgi:hypothetical protein
MNNEQFDKLLESALKRSAKAPTDEAAVNRVLSRISGPLPRQKQPFLAPACGAARLAVRAGLAAHGSTCVLRCARILRRHRRS